MSSFSCLLLVACCLDQLPAQFNLATYILRHTDPGSYWVGCMRNHPQNRIRDQWWTRVN